GGGRGGAGGGGGGAGGGAKAGAGGDRGRADDRGEAAVLRPLAGRGRKRDLRRGVRVSRRNIACAQRAALRAAQGRNEISVLPPRRGVGLRTGEDDAARRGWTDRHRRRQAGTHLGAGAMGPLPP